MNDILQQTPGQILKTAREAKQISINEIAQRLLLSKKIIVALEEDDYSNIFAQVYAEGYLKAYSQFLQISTDAILESFRNLNIYSKPEIKIEPKTQSGKSQEPTDSSKGYNRGRVLLIVFSVLILGALVFFVSKSFFGKNIEITNIQSTSSNTLNNSDHIISDNQMPIITSISEKTDHKQKTVSKKTSEKNTKNSSLMLDTDSTEVKTNDGYGEPKLIITKPKK
jgi:cytoskeleton protein RodZ